MKKSIYDLRYHPKINILGEEAKRDVKAGSIYLGAKSNKSKARFIIETNEAKNARDSFNYPLRHRK